MLQDASTLDEPKRIGFRRGDSPKGRFPVEHALPKPKRRSPVEHALPKPKRRLTKKRQEYLNRTGPYSRWLRYGGEYDGRSREGRFINMCRKELEDHLGGNLTVAQKILVERISYLRLRVALFDEQFVIEGKPLGELDYRVYGSLSNALVRATRELSNKPVRNGSTTLNTVLAELTR